MDHDFPESDWKVLRRLRELALERFCARVLEEIRDIASRGEGSSHRRYLEIFRLIDRRDDELARAFNDPRRSRAALQLGLIYAYGLLTPQEMAGFSPETRRSVESLIEVLRLKRR